MSVSERAIRTVFFDLDGTLIDSRELILSSYRHAMETVLGEVLPDARWLETLGRPLAVQLRDFARDGDQADEMLAAYLEHNERAHDDLLKSFPGVRAYVARLREEGFRLGIVTSKRREGTLRGLESCGYPTGWFAAIVTATDLEASKPDPDPVLLALKRAGEEAPGRTLYVGDSVYDMRSGRAAGTLTAAALWGSHDRDLLLREEPDYRLESIEDLDAILTGGAVAG